MKKQKGFSLIGILMATMIICLLYYVAMKFYFQKQIVDKETQKSLAKQGINTNSYKNLIDSAKDKVEEINKKIEEREKEFQDLSKYKKK